MKRSCPSCGPETGGEEKKGRGNPISVQLFPPELVEHIISFLPVRDVVALGQTCHYFHEVCDAEGVWRRICRRLSPRLREQGSGTRPWKRAAILNCTPSPRTFSSLWLSPTLFWDPSCSIELLDDLRISNQPSRAPFSGRNFLDSNMALNTSSL